jgi:ABC-type hemin transport system ATPase subunit
MLPCRELPNRSIKKLTGGNFSRVVLARVTLGISTEKLAAKLTLMVLVGPSIFQKQKKTVGARFFFQKKKRLLLQVVCAVVRARPGLLCLNSSLASSNECDVRRWFFLE